MSAKSWLTSLTGKIVTASTGLGAILFILSHFLGWIEDFQAWTIEKEEEARLDSVAHQMAKEYLQFRTDSHLPFIIESQFNAIYNELDSLAFITQQTTNLVFSDAFAKIQTVEDSNGCKYRFRVDPAGTFWIREKFTDEDGNTVLSFQYVVTYNRTRGRFEYVDYLGQVKTLKNCFE